MMNRSIHHGIWLLLTLFVMVAFAPTPALSQDQRFYMALKPGAFFPNGDLNDFDTGFAGEFAFGRRFTTNLAMEMDLGWYSLGANEQFSGAFNGLTYSAGATPDLDIFPFALNFKGILPYEKWEFYGLAGIGGYYVRARADLTATANNVTYSATGKDTDVVFGFTAGLGVTYNISPSWFVGAEGKYLFTTDATLLGVETNLNGVMAMGVIGYKF